MKYLGVDYGRKRIGLAISDGTFAQPLEVVKIENVQDGVNKVVGIVERQEIEQVVIGVSEGEMAEETRNFGDLISGMGICVSFWDETLSSKQAMERLIKGGKKKKIRKEMLDAAAAAITLQSFLDEKGEE